MIESCDIKGSSDASIRNVVPIDIGRITAVAPIEAVVCNGGTAGRLYHRYLESLTGIKAQVMPSTSPANAAWSLIASSPSGPLPSPGAPNLITIFNRNWNFGRLERAVAF